MADRPRSRWQEEIAARIDATRGVIRRYLIGYGIAQTLAVAFAAFWILDGWDCLYFAVTKLEQPGLLRTILIWAAAAVVAAVAIRWTVSRLLPALTDEAIALSIERHDPGYEGRLITAVQSKPRESELAAAISRRTQQEAADRVAGFDPSALIAPAPRRRAAAVAFLLGGAIAVLAAVQPSHLKRWADAYLFGVDDYWDDLRTTRLELLVARGVPERLIPFDEQRTIPAARGATLTLVATTQEGSERPPRVRLTIDDLSSRGDSQTVTMVGGDDGRYRHTLPRLFDDVELSLVAGDFATPVPYRVRVVPAPEVQSLRYRPTYPSYLGLGELSGQSLPLQSNVLSLPVGTRVTIEGTTGKPLDAVRLNAGDWRKTLDEAGIEDDTFTFDAKIGSASQSNDDQEDGREPPTPTDGRSILSVREPTEIELTLVDRDGLRSLAPLRLTIEPIADQPPEVSARPRGIGDAVTRRASVPYSGTVSDDYGVTQLQFAIGRSESDERLDVAAVPGRKVISLGDDDIAATLDLRELQPQLGERLAIALEAVDGKPADPRQVGRSETVGLTVVSDEELLAILRGKEVNLRQRFEQIVEEVTATRDDIALQQQREAEASALGDSPERTELRQRISAGVDRGLLGVRKNESEARAIYELFGDLRAEMVNNRVDTRDRLERIDNGVLAPLGRVVDRQFGQVDAAMESARAAIRTRSEIADGLATAERELSRLVSQLEAILSEMERRQSYNELIEELQKLTERYESLEKRTKERSVDSFLDDLLE